ncbi:MAG: S9 family peptidase [Alphaproteobacteria bacterium]
MRTLAWGLLGGVLLLGACDGSAPEETKSEAPAPQTSPAQDAAPVADASEAEDDTASLPSQTYDARVFFETTSAFLPGSSGLPFSPDGSEILVSWDKTGIFNAYALPVSGDEGRALTESSDNATYAASFFPEDGRLLFTADQGGNELNHVYVREEDGTVTDLTPGEKVKAIFGGWSSDFSRFYVLTNERDARFFDMYALATNGYERSMVFQNDGGFQIAAVSRDDRWLALDKPRSSADSDILLVDLSGDDKTPKLITEHEGNISHGAMDFTPDSTKLVYSTDEVGEWRQAWTYDLATGEKAPYVTADWDVSFVVFSPTGQVRVTGVNADGRTEVTLTDLETGEALALPELPEGNLANIRFSPDDRFMGFLLTSDRAPANVHVLDRESGTVRKLTETANPAIDPADLVSSEVIRYESFDGLEIPGILYKPHQASAETPVPALIWVHGGPGGQSRVGYSATIQHLVNHGYAILAANNRGSSGYGKTFYHMDDKRHGEVDLQDIVYAKTHMAGQDWVDAEKIGIIGGSYGGYMVAAALAFEPEVFEVGIDIFGVTNWVRTLKSIPPWWAANRDALYDELGDPATDEERLRRISPLFHAENIVRPLLVVQGANDPRVLQVESDEIVEKVRANGVPVEYIVFPDEGHGFRKRENRITASNAYVTFLEEHLR